MRVLLLKDVYKLGRAGDVKRVADGYGRNYLIPQGLAMKATPGAMKMAEHIRNSAESERTRLNQELGAVSDQIAGLKLTYPVKAGETGRLYGSITTMMIAEGIRERTGFEVDRRQIDSEPIKSLGVHTASVRLTFDLVPEVTILVHREGEPPETAYTYVEEAVLEGEGEEEFSELRADLEREAEAADEAESEPEIDAASVDEGEFELIDETEPSIEPFEEAPAGDE